MRALSGLVLAAAGLGLVGCNTVYGTPATIPSGPIAPAAYKPLPLIVNRLKCDVAAYLVRQDAQADNRLKVKKISGTLVFKLVRTENQSGGFGIAVAPAGVKIGATATASSESHQTVTTTLDIDMDLAAGKAADCKHIEQLPVAVIDLVALQEQIDAAAEGRPKIGVKKVTFEGDYYLQQQVGGKATVDVVVFKIADAGATATNQYVQSFKLEADTTGSPYWMAPFRLGPAAQAVVDAASPVK